MLISAILYLGISLGYAFFLCYSLLLPKKRQNLDETIDRKTESEENPNSNHDITLKPIGKRRGSYKKANLEIEIPNNDDFVKLGEKAFIVSYFRENCFPLSQKFLKPGFYKISKSAKWFLTICFEITSNLVILNKFHQVKTRTDVYVFCPLISCLVSLLFTTILTVILIKNVRFT